MVEQQSKGKGDVQSYWKVALPSDDLDQLMWGSEGKPEPSERNTVTPKFQRNWGSRSSPASKLNDDGANQQAGEERVDDREEVDDVLDSTERSDNLGFLAAATPTKADDNPKHTTTSVSETCDENDRIILEDIVWKQRSGFGKYAVGLLSHEWEQRRVALFESGLLRYYALPKDMEGVRYDPQNAVDPNRSPWVYDSDQLARGEMDLVSRPQRCDSSPTKRSLASNITKPLSNLMSHNDNSGGAGVIIQARQRDDNPGPTPYEIDITRKDNKEMWRFCFQSRAILIQWLATLKAVSGNANDDDDELDLSDGLHDHGFEPGDHIIRWEMLPILYPVQIHGIVLEAGSNCVIIADFGLASYDNKKLSGNDDLASFEDDDKETDTIMQAWEKIKPKEKKRLNVIAVTDPHEIRKWSKISYGDQVEKKKKQNANFFASTVSTVNNLLHGSKTSDDEGANDEVAGEEDVEDHKDVAKATSTEDEAALLDGEPEWFDPNYVQRRTSPKKSRERGECQSVFSVDKPEAKADVPKSDSAKLVLARTHFVLEHEDLLYVSSICVSLSLLCSDTNRNYADRPITFSTAILNA